MTKQRAAILQVIRADKCHHTAEEIFELAKDLLPGISRATVYNNLKALEAEQLIRKLAGEGAGARYDSAFRPHGHTVCTECGRVWDFNIPEFDPLITKAIGQTFDSYELKVRILCIGCKNKHTANKSEA